MPAIKDQYAALRKLLIEIEAEHGIKVTDIRVNWTTEYSMGTGRFSTLTNLEVNTTS